MQKVKCLISFQNFNFSQISMQPLIIYMHYETNDVECSYVDIKFLNCPLMITRLKEMSKHKLFEAR